MHLFSIFKRKNGLSDSEGKTNSQDDSLIFDLRSQISTLQSTITKNNRLTESLVSNAATEQLDSVLQGFSQSAAYMATQMALVKQNNNISTTDLAATIQLFLTSLEQTGARFIGEAGELVPYDPVCHSTSHPQLEVGTNVVIQVSGLKSPSGQVLRQAMVITK